ncbi:Cell division protein FtsB [Rhodospira trueperi]|uniref:Cell division protein FtsB n=2 Tax=Rhodospira trueperi TaxID=69960 RepID=A0A1G7F1C5_9PROT|nr:Cell division protein FtsB [Rhodospira trueperi]
MIGSRFMSEESVRHHRVRSVIVPLLLLATVAYFSYHAVNGERGLLAWWQVRQDIQIARADQAALEAERAWLEHRVGLLYDHQLRPDMLDERARDMLNLIGPDEVIVLPPEG